MQVWVAFALLRQAFALSDSEGAKPLFYKKNGPSEIRTRVTGVRGRRPKPLDDGTLGPVIITENLRFFYKKHKASTHGGPRPEKEATRASIEKTGRQNRWPEADQKPYE